MILKNKKASHVGMILSFVIFITFVVFLYVYLNPSVETPESKRDLLNEIGLRIINNISSSFSIISISIFDNPETNCILLSDFLFASGIAFEEFNDTGEVELTPANLIVKNGNYQIQESYSELQAKNLSIVINRINTEDNFFKIYYSREFDRLSENGIGSCSIIPFESNKSLEEGYVIGSVDTGKYIFEKNLYDIVERYNENYEKLKSELRISPGNEFGFEFVLSDETKLIAMEDAPSSGNIYAEEIPVQYVDEDANILSGFINVKVW